MSDRRWSVLVAIGVSTFVAGLDTSVVNTVLPLLSRELHASVAAIEWVSTIYLLVISALLLGVGRAGDLRGHKRMYLAGFALFVIASALCGSAWSANALVAMRGLQGIGAAMLFANAPAILTKAFPAEQRGRALGALATFTYLGLTAGPPLGGWLAEVFGWRSVFYINVPIGIAGIVLGWRAIEDDRPHGNAERFDVAGAALFTAGLVALLTALDQGHAWGWTSPLTLSLGAGALATLAAFVVVERRRAEGAHRAPLPAPSSVGAHGVRPPAMLDLSLFRSRVFSAATVTALFNYICVYSVLFVLPFLLIQGRGLGTQQAGLVLTAQPIVMAIVAPISGAMSDKIGSRLPSTIGMILLAIGLFLIARLADGGSLRAIAAALALVGLGIGIFVSPNNSALMGAAPRHRQGIAAGVLATARNVGMVLGIGISGAVFTTVLARGGPLVRGVQESLYVGVAVALMGAVSAFVSE